MDDLKRALPYTRRSRDNLRGYVFQMVAQTITLLPTSSEGTKLYHQFSDEAGRILRKGTIEDDGSFAKLSFAGYHQDRARAYLSMGDPDAALEALTIAEKQQRVDMTRWHSEMYYLRARAYHQMNEIEWACHQLQDAIRYAETTGSTVQKKHIKSLYKQMLTSHGEHPDVRHIGAMIRA
jgi:tetratricopeptide (TPR) repeat protein